MPLSVMRPFLLALLILPVGCVATDGAETEGPGRLPVMRWDHRPEAKEWTATTLAALEAGGAALARSVPADIEEFCPGYEAATQRKRRAFWAGFLSALAKHESTWKPGAVGGEGRWIGLMQIAPGTARAYGCDVSDRKGLKDGSANLACAVRIAATQVRRDGAIYTDGSGGWRGVARDWAPMRVERKRADIAAWTRARSYCR